MVHPLSRTWLTPKRKSDYASARRLDWQTLVLAGAFVPAVHRSSPLTAPAAPLGVRWPLVNVCGLQMSLAKQSGVSVSSVSSAFSQARA